MQSSGKVYLDFNATTPLRADVRRAIADALDLWANPSSANKLGAEAKRAVDSARSQVATAVDTSSPECVIFTSGGTEANNQVIRSAIDLFHEETATSPQCLPHIITSSIEHDSILEPLRYLENAGKCEVDRVGVDPQTGTVRPADVAACVKFTTRLVTVMHANNETGVIQEVFQPIHEIAAAVRRAAAKLCNNFIQVHTDAAQTVGKIPVSMKELDVDLLTVVGHKFYGPRIGALCRRNIETKVKPLLYGGGQEYGYRSGTENTPMIVGLGAAAEAAAGDIESARDHLSTVRDHFETRLMEVFGDEECRIHFHQSPRLPNTSSVAFPSAPSSSSLLERADFYASAGAACHSPNDSGSPILRACGVSAPLAARTLRFSFGLSSTKQQADAAVADLDRMLH